jgi:hypothetical protein
VVLLRDLLHGAAGEGAERLLHDEYGVEDILLFHLLNVAPDRLHAGLSLVGEEHVDLQGGGERLGLTMRRRRRRNVELNGTGDGPGRRAPSPWRGRP